MDASLCFFCLNPRDGCKFLFFKVEISFYLAPRGLQLAQICQGHKRPVFTKLRETKRHCVGKNAGDLKVGWDLKINRPGRHHGLKIFLSDNELYNWS